MYFKHFTQLPLNKLRRITNISDLYHAIHSCLYRSFFIVCLSCFTISLCYGKIFAKDNRRPLSEKENQHYKAIGRLFAKNHCSATATVTLERNIITSSAHCFYQDGKAISDVSNYQFYLWVAGEEKAFRLKKIQVGSRFPSQDLGLDWAIIQLEQSVPDSILPIPIKPFYSSELNKLRTEIIHISFHLNFNKQTVKRISQCQLYPIKTDLSKKTYNNLLFHDCDTQKMASGSPLMVKYLDKPYLIALHKGGFKDSNHNIYDGINNFNYAVKTNEYFFQQLTCINASLTTSNTDLCNSQKQINYGNIHTPSQ